MLRFLMWMLLSCCAILPAVAKEQLTVDLVNEPASLDPHRQWNPDSYYVYRNLFDNLLSRDDDGQIVGEIATQWHYASPTQVDFTLRRDVKFHDGQPLTADDVAFSLKRIIDPAFASPQRGQFDSIIEAQALAPDVLRVTTASPYPALLAQLVKLSIVPRHVLEAVGDQAFNLAPIGSGPYRFARWQRGVAVLLTRNSEYWGREGAFASALFRPVPDAATRLADVQSGSADLVVSLDSDQAAQLEHAAQAKLLSVATERVSYVSFNTFRPPFNDQRVRRAAALAIDRQALDQALLGGREQIVNQLLTPAHVGFSADLADLPYDPAQAKAILASVGELAQLPVELATTPVFDQRIVQALQQMLTEVGFNVRISVVDMASFLQRMNGDASQTANFAFVRYSCACQDADGVLYPLLYSQNRTQYKDPAIDALLLQARSLLDAQQRQPLYRAVNLRLNEQVAVVPLFQSVSLYGAAKALQWQPTANESLFLNRMAWRP